MTNKFTVEKHWTTKSGLEAVIIMTSIGHRCGYVGVGKESPLNGIRYSDQIDLISQEQADSQSIGLKSPVLLFTATCGSDDTNKIRRSLDIVIDVHGGLTYSGNGDGEYPIASNLWWFGFDTAHYGDNPELGGQPLEYCIDQCESMAVQLINYGEQNDTTKN